MSLPDSYTVKTGSIPAYFDAILDAQPPERFSIKFLENLGFTSTNDRLLIGILKELRFLNSDGVPQQRYFEFMDRSQAKKIVAEGIRDAYSELFAINTKANELPASDVRNKLRTLYAGKKTDGVIERIATTFAALCEYADFSQPGPTRRDSAPDMKKETVSSDKKSDSRINTISQAITLDSLQYHINIVLPETRDQGVYDAIFRSLREHLGTRHG